MPNTSLPSAGPDHPTSSATSNDIRMPSPACTKPPPQVVPSTSKSCPTHPSPTSAVDPSLTNSQLASLLADAFTNVENLGSALNDAQKRSFYYESLSKSLCSPNALSEAVNFKITQLEKRVHDAEIRRDQEIAHRLTLHDQWKALSQYLDRLESASKDARDRMGSFTVSGPGLGSGDGDQSSKTRPMSDSMDACSLPPKRARIEKHGAYRQHYQYSIDPSHLRIPSGTAAISPTLPFTTHRPPPPPPPPTPTPSGNQHHSSRPLLSPSHAPASASHSRSRSPSYTGNHARSRPGSSLEEVPVQVTINGEEESSLVVGSSSSTGPPGTSAPPNNRRAPSNSELIQIPKPSQQQQQTSPSSNPTLLPNPPPTQSNEVFTRWSLNLPTNASGQRICWRCKQTGRHNQDGKCIEKWGPSSMGKGTVCDRCRKRICREANKKKKQEEEEEKAAMAATIQLQARQLALTVQGRQNNGLASTAAAAAPRGGSSKKPAGSSIVNVNGSSSRRGSSPVGSKGHPSPTPEWTVQPPPPPSSSLSVSSGSRYHGSSSAGSPRSSRGMDIDADGESDDDDDFIDELA